MTDDTGYCEDKVAWMRANGGIKSHPISHAYDHSAKPRGDYCFWCGKHREDEGFRKPEAQGYSFENWMEDALEFGFEHD